MGYPLRVCFDGALYHITIRGNNRESIFGDDTDRQKCLRLLKRSKDRFRFKLHAYALMTNHVHLIMEPACGTTVSRIMQGFTIAYTKYVNRRYGRVGHVFQGRFHSRLIDKDLYFLVASRYVHLNPVRAKLVSHPAKYLWSSYRTYQHPFENLLELVDVSDLLALHGSLFGSAEPDQRAAYCEFVEQALISDIGSKVDI